jgi:hypothetical protein
MNIYEVSTTLLLYIVLITNFNIMFESKKIAAGFSFSIFISISAYFVTIKIFN